MRYLAKQTRNQMEIKARVMVESRKVPARARDELSPAAMIDPSMIRGRKEFSVDPEVDPGRSYGETLSLENGLTLEGRKLTRPASSVSRARSYTTRTLTEEVTQRSQ